MSDIDRVPFPPELWPYLTNNDRVGTVVSCNRLDAGNFAVLLQLKVPEGTVYAAGTVAISELEPHDIVKLSKLEGESKIPVGVKIA